ncbi:cytochrome c3 family protein [Shewanella sp. WPAGA9]|uniref:cytochrome c3 family protein n=1 Tax=Shewanella sp. ENK2 TaxID=2775245 RepID=UPI0017875F24|nr:cytochrome c3 family protein [Shewanella sp. WPAGA9]
MKFLVFTILVLITTFNCNAKDGQIWHESVYDMGCQSCHDNGVKNYPSDQSCLNCHQQSDLIKSSERTAEELWQNPHNNLHYGKDVPCQECHSEHTNNKKPMCLDCHTFKYPKFKG